MNLSDFLYPKRCFGCKAGGKYICNTCLIRVRRARTFSPPFLDGRISLWRYEGVIRKTLIALKYKFVKDAAEELVESYMNEVAKKNLPKKATLVPIPMHKQRKKWRGFNQAEELGRMVSENLGWVFSPNLLSKTKKTRPQIELKGALRQKNLKGAFSFNQKHSLPKGYIVLFDDVWTTGSTLKEATGILKKEGVKKIYAMTIAD